MSFLSKEINGNINQSYLSFWKISQSEAKLESINLKTYLSEAKAILKIFSFLYFMMIQIIKMFYFNSVSINIFSIPMRKVWDSLTVMYHGDKSKLPQGNTQNLQGSPSFFR